MTLYIVRAKPKNDLSELQKELELGKISKMRPFGETLHYALQDLILAIVMPYGKKKIIVLCHYFCSVCFYDITNDVLAFNDRTDTEEL